MTENEECPREYVKIITDGDVVWKSQTMSRPAPTRDERIKELEDEIEAHQRSGMDSDAMALMIEHKSLCKARDKARRANEVFGNPMIQITADRAGDGEDCTVLAIAHTPVQRQEFKSWIMDATMKIKTITGASDPDLQITSVAKALGTGIATVCAQPLVDELMKREEERVRAEVGRLCSMGRGTLSSVSTIIGMVPGVKSVSVFDWKDCPFLGENWIAIVVDGGFDHDVSNAIERAIPIGIETVGWTQVFGSKVSWFNPYDWGDWKRFWKRFKKFRSMDERPNGLKDVIKKQSEKQSVATALILPTAKKPEFIPPSHRPDGFTQLAVDEAKARIQPSSPATQPFAYVRSDGFAQSSIDAAKALLLAKVEPMKGKKR